MSSFSAWWSACETAALPKPQAQKGGHPPRENLRTCVVVIAHEFGDKEADRWNELCVELPDLLVVLGIGLALHSHVSHHSEGEFVEYVIVHQCLILVGELQPARESVGRAVRAGSTPRAEPQQHIGQAI